MQKFRKTREFEGFMNDSLLETGAHRGERSAERIGFQTDIIYLAAAWDAWRHERMGERVFRRVGNPFFESDRTGILSREL